MEMVSILSSSEVLTIIESYPAAIRERILILRQLIVETANVTEGVTELEETLKWGEPSFNVKSGSPVRIDWKDSTPENYYVFVNCQTKLVDTFRELYSDVLQFQGNRAIILNLTEATDEKINHALKHCLALALTYQKVKHLPLLGA